MEGLANLTSMGMVTESRVAEIVAQPAAFFSVAPVGIVRDTNHAGGVVFVRTKAICSG